MGECGSILFLKYSLSQSKRQKQKQFSIWVRTVSSSLCIRVKILPSLSAVLVPCSQIYLSFYCTDEVPFANVFSIVIVVEKWSKISTNVSL